MSLFDQVRSINKSAVALTTAQAFLVGYAVPLVTMVMPQFISADYVQAGINFWHNCLSNPVWMFLFFKATLNSGVSFAIGALMKTNAFDKFRTFFPSSRTAEPVEPQPITTKNL
jgi:hypothetical protein